MELKKGIKKNIPGSRHVASRALVVVAHTLASRPRRTLRHTAVLAIHRSVHRGVSLGGVVCRDVACCCGDGVDRT